MVKRERFHVTVRRYGSKPVTGGLGIVTDFDNFTDTVETIEVEVDLRGIAQDLGQKVARSKGRRSRAMNGRVIVKAVKP